MPPSFTYEPISISLMLNRLMFLFCSMEVAQSCFILGIRIPKPQLLIIIKSKQFKWKLFILMWSLSLEQHFLVMVSKMHTSHQHNTMQLFVQALVKSVELVSGLKGEHLFSFKRCAISNPRTDCHHFYVETLVDFEMWSLDGDRLALDK